MRLQCQHVLVFACALLYIADGGSRTYAAGETGSSTIRTVSISNPAPGATIAPSIQELPSPAGSQARFTRPSMTPTTTPTATTRQAASTATFAAGSTSKQAPESAPSSLVIVTTGAPQKPAETNWVQQAQYESRVPVPAAPAAPQQSSFTIEPITPESTGPVIAPPAAASPTTSSMPTPAATAPRPPIATMQQPPAAPASQPQSPVADKLPPAAALVPLNAQILNRVHQREANLGNSGRASLSQLPQRTPVRPATSSTPRPKAKPFQGVESAPTVSPYLNLDRNDDDGVSTPNYYSFVRPQLEQQAANRGQQLEIQRLQRQLQNGTVAAPQYRTAAQPETGTAARFMDTSQYFSGWQR